MTLPNFLIIGAAKSGTTALHHCLKQHPQVYMSPRKETYFFAFEGQEVRFRGPGDEEANESAITNLEAYQEQFRDVHGEVAIGEATPWYLYSERAAQNIQRRIPDAKLIAVLRNPVDRAFSSYLHVVRDGRESLSFGEGLLAEDERVGQGWEFIWHYRRAGAYAAQVQRYLDLFPREQMRFYLYEDFLADPALLLKDMYGFLGVDTGFEADTSFRPNATGVPKSQLLGRLLLRPNPIKTTVKRLTPERLRDARYKLSQRINRLLIEKPSVDKATYDEVLASYRSDISTLQDLIGRDLSVWENERLLEEAYRL